MTIDYARTCFVVMPFGTKPVGRRRGLGGLLGLEQTVDFDRVYDTVFAPAIAAVPLPEGGRMVPRRADRDFHAGLISQDMFCSLEYSRFVLGDITGLNPNVFLELGARYRARASGTALFRQQDRPIPFDVAQVKAFPYAFDPEAEARKSRDLITRVLTESLTHNRLDSPVWQALQAQRALGGAAQDALRQAEDALRANDAATAERHLRAAVRHDPHNPLTRFRLGTALRNRGAWTEALAEFDAAITHATGYAEAWREKGIAENKLFTAAGTPPGMADGESSLLRALELEPGDFDAAAALGGVLKRRGDYDGAAERYQAAVTVSNGHPYPLLNLIACRARTTGRVDLTPHQNALDRAERLLRPQVENGYDAPWTAFDLAEILLLTGRTPEALELIAEAARGCTAAWPLVTFRETLDLFAAGGAGTPALAEARVALDAAIAAL